MLCKIADLIVDVPAADGLALRCRNYLLNEEGEPDIVIREADYRPESYLPMTSPENVAYMESAVQFCAHLLRFHGLYLHASAVELDGQAYLFSGPCGMGKSTHTRLWQHTFGAAAQVFNDDKPALRWLDGKWYAYGTPWCGKDGINQNKKVPLAGICFLKQSQRNSIRKLTPSEALPRLLSQTLRRRLEKEQLDLLLGHMDNLVRRIPIYELENKPEPEAARLSYETMRRGAEEAGL
jgi:hypothetical protein